MIDGIAIHLDTLEPVVSTEVLGDKVNVEVVINKESFDLEIDFGGTFPKSLPPVLLLNTDIHGFMPHVCWKREICYTDGEGVSIDTSQPEAIAEYAITKVIEILSIDKSKREDNFFDEFEGYWNTQETNTTYSFFEPSDKLEMLNIHVDKNNNSSAFFPLINENNLDDGYAFSKICKSKKTQMHAVYLPLSKKVFPPHHGEPISIDFLNTLINALSDENKTLWNTALQKKEIKKNIHILVSQPRPSGGVSLFGLNIPYGLNWLNGKLKTYKHKIIPLMVKRHTPNHLLQRAGAELSITDKKVTIIGCGAIGSRIAELLIMSGIRHLALIDHDVYNSDNLFRHVLDSKYIGCYKVDALDKQLKSRFPYITINPIQKRLNELKDIPNDQDIIIDASGDPTLGCELNIEHKKEKDSSLLLTTWLEPLGLGGHVVLSDNKTNGCLHCLYHLDNTERLFSSTNFVVIDQNVSRNLTGCGGAFIPFGAIDAIKTAEIATRMTVDALTSIKEESTSNKYQWWRGDNKAAVKAKIEITPWYSDCKNDVSEQLENMFNEGCPVCRKK